MFFVLGFYMTDFVRSTRWFYPPTWIDFWLIMALKFSYRFLLSVFCFRFYMTGYRASTHWLYPPTWVDFWLIMTLKFNQCFLLNIFCFFRLRHAVFTSVKPSSQGGILFMPGDGFAVPRHPLGPSQLKMWGKPEPKKWVNIPQGRKGALAPLHKKNMAKQMIVAKIQKSYLVSPQPTYFYITDFVRSTHWLYPPTWVDFCLLIALKFN